MIKKTLNRVFSSRIFYIVFSILVAFTLWVYVEISLNETVRHRVTEIPITFINEEVLRNSNFIMSSATPRNVTLTFIDCPRTVRPRLNRDTISITVDLAEITSTGYSLLPFELTLPQGIRPSDFSDISRSINNITLSIDRLLDMPIPVDARYTGSVAEGFIAGETEFIPQTIMIDGPESIVQRISKVWVPIEREYLSATFTDNLPFVLLDENGEELDDELRGNLAFSQDTIRVTVPVSTIKDIVLRVDRISSAGANLENSLVTIRPSVITVSGDPENLMDFNSLVLGTVDLSSFASVYTNMFPIALPNDLINHSGETQALVEIEIVGLDVRVISVPNPRWVNAPPDHTVSTITQTHDVRIRGKEADLEKLTESNIRVVADLTDYGPGIHTIPARVYIDGDVGDVGPIGSYAITVRIMRDP